MNRKILNHFKKNDPTLYRYAIRVEGKIEKITKEKPEFYFHKLCREIVCQQLSAKAGEVIFNRFQKLFSGIPISASHILSSSDEALRSSGISHAKAGYIRNLAEAVINNNLPISSLDTMADDGIMGILTKIKGIGPWTAQMFLMFTLARENIFSHGDLGLKKGIIKIYKFKKEPTKKQVEKIISKWSPYKTYASRILWASLEIN